MPTTKKGRRLPVSDTAQYRPQPLTMVRTVCSVYGQFASPMVTVIAILTGDVKCS